MLDTYQTAAAAHGGGAALTLAGPGSGKTTVLVHRIVNLIQTHGVSPERILVVTFTRDAAREMRERYLSLCGEASTAVTFGTFHGICYSILRQEAGFRDAHILTSREKRDIYKKLCADIPEAADDEAYADYIEQAIGLCRGTWAGAERVVTEGADSARYRRSDAGDERIQRAANLCGLSEERLAEAYHSYGEAKRRIKALDFDDLIARVHEGFLSDEEMLGRWRDRFSYFLVDEMQDMDERQFELLRLLAEPEGNLFAVGDDDQSIYSFRGAAPHIMLSFREYYPDAAIYRLERNYRSGIEICGAAERLIAHNKERYIKRQIPMSGESGRIKIRECGDAAEEARAVCALIKADSRLTAVLYRNRAAAAPLIRLLEREGIDYRQQGGSRKRDEHGIREDIAAYLSAADSIASGDVRRGDLLRILNRPVRYLGREELNEDIIDPDRVLAAYPQDSAERDAFAVLFKQLRLIGNMRPFAAICYIRRGVGYDEYLTIENERRRLPEGTLEAELDGIAEELKSAETLRDAPGLLGVGGRAQEQLQSQAQPNEAPPLSLMTFHGSKGLEFERVIIIDCNDGATPSRRAATGAALEEERRLFYVALTRARSEAVFFTVRKSGGKQSYPSRFLGELSENDRKAQK